MGWIGFTAGRLASLGKGGPGKGKNKKRGTPVPVLSIAGISVGVLALTIIISVMNGFQLGFIESILEVSSYYVRVESPPWKTDDRNAVIEKIKTIPGVKAAVPFREMQVLVRGNWGQQAVVVRGLNPSALEEDSSMMEKLVIEDGAFTLEYGPTILLGAELAVRLRVEVGDVVRLISISGQEPLASIMNPLGDNAAKETAAVSDETLFTVCGLFRSGFYEYDLGWAFINFDKAGEIGGEDYTLGIKLNDRWQDKKAAALLEAALSPPSLSALSPPVQTAGENLKIKTWREYNRAFFGALRTEKLFMFALVGLIFIVVGLNIYQAQRRVVLERREEIGLLRAVGAGDMAVRLVFVWDGLLIGLAGAGTGTAIGLLISYNISGFFTLLEKIINGVMSLLNQGGHFAVFSTEIFYIKELQARVIPQEALFIFLFGLFSALGAAWFASSKVSRIRPAEVLRDE
jgi:lipoprotein-releasing system permease protein